MVGMFLERSEVGEDRTAWAVLSTAGKANAEGHLLCDGHFQGLNLFGT